MILVGSQRSGPGALASHLLNDRDNDHVELVELRGFVSTDLHGALAEIAAVAKGTQCKQFMFSLSLNPPKGADASLDDMRMAAEKAEQALGLAGQPRAIVCHEKEGRRHIHAVWSRIDVASMKAIPMAFFQNRLMTLGKELYLEHGWDLPDGHKENGWKNPLNFTLAEWQQAKRLDLDPRELKQLFRETWAQSDGLKSFQAGLEDRGYFLAQGDRRGFVAVDIHGEVFSIARQIGIKTKELEARLGSPEALPGVTETQSTIETRLRHGLRGWIRDHRTQQDAAMAPLTEERANVVAHQRIERTKLDAGQAKRFAAENRERQGRVRRGVRGVFDILTGRAAQIRKVNDREAFEGYRRDRAQRERLFKAQLDERQDVQRRIEDLRRRHRLERTQLIAKVGLLLSMDEPRTEVGRPRARGHGLDGPSL